MDDLKTRARCQGWGGDAELVYVIGANKVFGVYDCGGCSDRRLRVGAVRRSEKSCAQSEKMDLSGKEEGMMDGR